MARTKHPKYTGAIASARVELEKVKIPKYMEKVKIPKYSRKRVTKTKDKATVEEIRTCKLDRGTCSNQYSAEYSTGCSSKEPCPNMNPSKEERRGMRNRGLHDYRFKDNSLEKKFAKAWNEQNIARPGTPEGRGTLDYLLAKDCNYPAGEVTDRDREVAATVIQWLGSPVGQSFLRDVQLKEEPDYKAIVEEIVRTSKNVTILRNELRTFILHPHLKALLKK